MSDGTFNGAGYDGTARSRVVSLVLLLVLGLSWGLSFSVIKIAADDGLPAAGIVMVTSLVGGAILLAVCAIRRQMPRWDRRHLVFYLGCAILSAAAPLYLEALVAQHIPAGVLTIVATMPPMFTYVFALTLRMERLAVMRVAGIVCGLASALLLLLPSASLPDPAMRPWVALALAIPVLYGAYHIYASKLWPGDSDAFQVAAGSLLVTFVIMLGVALATGEVAPMVTGWGGGHWAVIGLAVLFAADAVLLFAIIRRAGPVFSSQANFISVVAGVFWGMAIFGEEPSVWIWASLVLLVAALALALPRRDSAG